MSDELNKSSEPAAAEAPASSEAAQDAAPENATEVANTEATDAERMITCAAPPRLITNKYL